MRNHRKILGGLFIAWAVLQAIGAIFIALVSPPPELQGAPLPAIYWVLMAVFIAAYAWAGFMLFTGRSELRFLTLGLSIVALFAFPLGTMLGIYGLFVSFRQPHRPGPEPEPDRERWVERHA